MMNTLLEIKARTLVQSHVLTRQRVQLVQKEASPNTTVQRQTCTISNTPHDRIARCLGIMEMLPRHGREQIDHVWIG